MMRNLVFAVLLFGLLAACDPCEDCGASLVFEPTVEMIFVNADSLKDIRDSLGIIAFNDSALASNSFILDTLQDRIEEIDLILATMDSALLELEKAEILNVSVPMRKADSALFAELNKDADSISQLFTQAITTINSGSVELENVVIVENEATIPFTDSATSWNFPLSFDGKFSTYTFDISDESFLIQLDYENFTEVDEERNVLIRARDLTLIDTLGFDSVDVCERNCFDGNATFTFYF
ncbi:MAG: hypothetical protein AAF616_10095 [Bacteroidota bacterium]